MKQTMSSPRSPNDVQPRERASSLKHLTSRVFLTFFLVQQIAVKTGCSTTHLDLQTPGKGFSNPNEVFCYRNAAFILLLHTPVIINWAYDHYRQHDEGSCIICSFSKLAEKYWLGERSSRNGQRETEDHLQRFWGLITTGWGVQLNEQQDVSEFLDQFVSGIRQDYR